MYTFHLILKNSLNSTSSFLWPILEWDILKHKEKKKKSRGKESKLNIWKEFYEPNTIIGCWLFNR
jgi:hypothetical protein